MQKIGDKAPGGAAFTGDAMNKLRIQDLIAALDSQITILAGSVNQLFGKTSKVQSELGRVLQNAATFRTSANQWKAEVQRSAARFYMTGAWEETLPILNSRNLDDVATARVYMHSVLGSATGLVARYREQSRTYEVERRRSVTLGQSLRSQIAVQQTELQRLSDLRRQKQEMLGGVVQSFGTGSSAIRSLIEAAENSQVAAPMSDRFVLAPVSGPVSSPFGWRIHPLYGYHSFHTGVDLAVAQGTPIRAARDGVVLDVALIGPFGLATVIDNGSKIATVYAHQSFATVHPGERVKAGQVIGLVGCTGWCTGPHLHFEVWFDGQPVDPLPWLANGAHSALVRLA